MNRDWRAMQTWALMGWLLDCDLIEEAKAVSLAADMDGVMFQEFLVREGCPDEILRDANWLEVVIWLQRH